MEWTKKQYNQQYENYMPWIEDNVLYYFTKDNKASYATKGMLYTLTTHQTTILTIYYRPAQQDQDHRQRTSRQRPRWRKQPRRRPSRTRWTPTTRRRPRLQRRHQPHRERRQGRRRQLRRIHGQQCSSRCQQGHRGRKGCRQLRWKLLRRQAGEEVIKRP
jgi:hypothetical protein